MFVVTGSIEGNDKIGVAHPIPQGYEVEIFNRKETFILKQNKKRTGYHAYVKIREGYFILYNKAGRISSRPKTIGVYIGEGQYAYIKLDIPNLNLVTENQ